MDNRLFKCLMVVVPALMAFSGQSSEGDADSGADSYVPAAVFCANGSENLCSLMPGMIGPDPALQATEGYHGLAANVPDASQDSQSPFDNMAWQMFVALNWAADNPGADPGIALKGDQAGVWTGWGRPEDVFGGEPGICDNPDSLPRVGLLTKSDGQPDDRMSEFLEASTNLPLIDVAGNWAVFERRISPREVEFLKSNQLTTLAGQAVYSRSHDALSFPAGDSQADGTPGAMELKIAWRILPPGDPGNSRFYTRQALLEVSADEVADSDQPICATVTLGLVGMHIIQKNPVEGALRDQWIWATFEHQDNAPLSSEPADPTDWKSYGVHAKSDCPVGPQSESARQYSFFNPDCQDCTSNQPPDRGDDSQFLWQSQPPYAGRYLTNGKFGTQVVQCAQPYYLTSMLNDQWQQRLQSVNSVFANYTLIGTQWGASIEPTPGEFWRRAVPDFLSNTTMETYLQTDTIEINQQGEMTSGPGSCIGCHSFGTLAWPTGKDEHRMSSDFSFLPGLAVKRCDDFDAGPIWNNEDAQTKCPEICTDQGLNWNGQWKTTVPGSQSVCGCCLNEE